MDVDDSRTDPDPRLDDIGDEANKTIEKPRYKSWKKKYRKMRMVYDQRTFESEELHKQELKGIETAKRLAIENDRILDLLLDINNCPQIPLDKRIDISLEPNEPVDDSDTTQPLCPSKSLRTLLATVPHITEEELVKRSQLPEIEHPNTLPNADTTAKPPSFLTPDDIDNYLFEIDSRIGGPAANLPTLAPLAHHGKHAADLAPGSVHPHLSANQTTANSSSPSYQLRNPASVYNWLRKNCPQVFLQDAEKDSHANGDKDGGDGPAANGTTGKRGAKTPASRAAGTRQSKRASAVKSAAPRASSMDMDLMASDEGTPAPAATIGRGGGKRKRVIDDDPGYRPKGGSSRPTKKKRKSEGVVEATPTAAGKRRGGKAKKSDEKIDLEAEAAEAEKEAATLVKTEMDVDGEGEEE